MIVVPSVRGRTINLRIPVPILLLGGVAAVGLTVFAGSRAFQLAQVARQTAAITRERDQLKIESTEQALELEKWRTDVQSLTARVEKLETQEQGLQDLQERVHGLLGGTGGPDTAATSTLSVTVSQSATADDLLRRLALLESSQAQNSASLTQAVASLERYNAQQAATPKGWPSAGSITDAYGWRSDPVGRGRVFHEGIDIGGVSGSEVSARANGVVRLAGWKDEGYGLTVVIDHGNGLQTLYAHNSTVLVHVGEFVKRGEIIARMGSTGRSTGPHIHYEVHRQGQAVDPTPYLN